MSRAAHAGGFTLLELLVVLVLMGLAAALVAPALLRPERSSTGLESLIPTVRQEAARRGETLYLRVAASGEWRLEGATPSRAIRVAAGKVEPFAGVPLTLIVSPLGTCSFDVPSAAAARVIPLDPLSCKVASSNGRPSK